MFRRYLSAAVLMVLIVVLTGCGVTKKAQERAAEKLVESALEKATGVKVDAQGQKLTLKGEDGATLELSTSDAGKVPKGFPLPVLPGFTTEGFVETKTDGKLGWLGSFYFKTDFKQTVETYVKELEGLGLKMDSMTGDNEAILFINGKIGEKPYGGILTFGKGEDGRGELAIMFGESDEE